MMVSVHVFINDACGGALLPASFACRDCGRKVRPAARTVRVVALPVLHSVMAGVCSGCGAPHMMLTAKTKEACDALSTIAERMVRDISREVLGD
jgi:hypothetical protein